jgi:hypothetical protein
LEERRTAINRENRKRNKSKNWQRKAKKICGIVFLANFLFLPLVEAKKSWQSFLSDLPPNEVGPFDLKTSTTPDYFQRLFGSSLRLMNF